MFFSPWNDTKMQLSWYDFSVNKLKFNQNFSGMSKKFLYRYNTMKETRKKNS